VVEGLLVIMDRAEQKIWVTILQVTIKYINFKETRINQVLRLTRNKIIE